MSKMVLDVPPDIYQLLRDRADRSGQPPESVTLDILKAALRPRKQTGRPAPRTAREILQAAGRVRPLSEDLRRRIIPGVTLEEVRAAISQAGGPPLSEIIISQR